MMHNARKERCDIKSPLMHRVAGGVVHSAGESGSSCAGQRRHASRTLQ